MRILKSLSVSMLIVGAIIGAGFASGAEITAFFGSGFSIFNAVLCSVLIFVFCAALLGIGNRLAPKDLHSLHKSALGRFSPAADALITLNSAIVTAGMIAALAGISCDYLGLPQCMLPIAAGIVAIATVVKGISGMIKLNAIAIPLVIATMTVVCLMSASALHIKDPISTTGIKPDRAVVYVAMNLTLAAGAITSVRDLNRREIVFASAAAAAIIGTLLVLLTLALNSTAEITQMPTLSMSSRLGKSFFYAMLLSMLLSILTTLITSLESLTTFLTPSIGNKPLAAVLTFSACALLSTLGFTNVVSALYPIIGVIGTVYIGVLSFFSVNPFPGSD